MPDHTQDDHAHTAHHQVDRLNLAGATRLALDHPRALVASAVAVQQLAWIFYCCH